MDRLRQAVDGSGKRVYEALKEPTVAGMVGGEVGWFATIYEAARSVLDAPRIGWCQEHRSAAANVTRGFPVCEWSELNRELTQMPCRMVEASVVVGVPQEGGEE